MSSTAWILALVLLLTVLGTLTLVFITVNYYWVNAVLHRSPARSESGSTRRN